MISPKETFRRGVELVAVHGPLLVVDDERGLLGVLSDETLLRGLLPAYIQAQDLLAGVLDEHSAEALFTRAQERKVGDLLTGDIPLVQGEDSLIEVAAVMVRSGSSLIAVLEEGRIIGGITLHDLLAQLTR